MKELSYEALDTEGGQTIRIWEGDSKDQPLLYHMCHTTKCELCEVRDQEVKKLVRAKHGADELILELGKENDELRAKIKVQWDELQILSGRLGRSAEFTAMREMVIPPESPSKPGVFERLRATFARKHE